MREHDDGRVTLYHFTSLAAWERIQATGMIQVTDPQLNPTPEGPSGVVALEDGTFSLVGADADGVPHAVGKPFSEPLTLGEVLPADHDLGPLVVHLTEESRDCSSILLENNAVRIAVSLPRQEAHQWIQWAGARGIPEPWLAKLCDTHADAPLWFVVERPIPATEWIDVMSMDEYEPLWERAE